MSALAPVAYRVEITRNPPRYVLNRLTYSATLALIDDGGTLCAERVETRHANDLWPAALSAARFKARCHGGTVGEVVDLGLCVLTYGRETWRHERLASRCAGTPCQCGKAATGVLIHEDDAPAGLSVTTGPACCEPCAFSRAKAQREASKLATWAKTRGTATPHEWAERIVALVLVAFVAFSA